MRFVSLLAIVCALLVSAAVFAQTETCTAGDCVDDNTTATKIVRIGYTQFPPFSRTSGLGTAQGYSIDLLRQFLEPQGYALSFVEHDNPAQMLESLSAGQIDATTLLAINEQRAEIGRYTQAFESFTTSVFMRTDSAQAETIADLSGMRIGITTGSFGARLIEAVPGSIPVYYGSMLGLLVPLLAGEVEAIAAPTRGLQSHINTTDLNALIQATGIELAAVDGGILVHPDRPVLLADLDSAISAALQSGTIAALQKKWFAPPPRELSATELQFLYTVCAILALLLLIWIKAYARVRRLAKSLDAKTGQMRAALDATGATFLLADKNMRIDWCNDAFLAEFPSMRYMLIKNKGLEDYLVASFLKENEENSLCEADIRKKALDRIERLKQGEEIDRIKTTADGRVLKQRFFKLPSGEYGAISTDVSELAEERDMIRRDADRLEATNKRLERFSQTVAHDLVAPIRNQRVLLEVIRDEMTEANLTLPAEVHDCFAQSDALLTRQAQLVTDLLEWSKSLHAGPRETFNPADRVRNAVSLAAVPRGFSVTYPDDMPKLRASPVAWELVMRNLVSNAIKHHDRDSGEVRISFRLEESSCVFLVADDGPGIPPAHLERIFEPFETLKSKDQGAGSGLGLSFVREAVEAWGGTVEALGTKGARGTCFRFSVPLAEPDWQAESANILPLTRSGRAAGV